MPRPASGPGFARKTWQRPRHSSAIPSRLATGTNGAANSCGRPSQTPATARSVELAQLVPRLTLVTQNVDSLHQRAGSTDVIEYHGNMLRDRCTVEGALAERAPFPSRDCPNVPAAANCCARRGLVRRSYTGPRVAGRPSRPRRTATRFCRSARRPSSIRRPGLAERALRSGATVIEINLEPTDLSRLADFVMRGTAGTLLPGLVGLLRPARA